MSRAPHLTVGEIVRRYGPAILAAFGASLSYRQKKVLQNLGACQTPALGGHVYRCDSCAQLVGTYNSCCDRHCPTCQGREAAKWTTARLAEVLPVPYFHIVFTLPHEWGPLILQNKTLFYNILFQAASQTLLTIATDPKHLGAHIGFLAVLHTWGQTLQFHPHLHCVVPGGGIALDGKSWVGSRQRFFLPVRVLSALYRGKFLSLVRSAFDSGQIRLRGSLNYLSHPNAFRALLDSVKAKTWGINTRKPFSTPDQVVKYLARYTHRIAISNDRLVSIDGGQVTFWWKDRAHGNQSRLMTLPVTEFLRRFLLHVLPKGFVRIRYYGLMAHRHRQRNIARCRQLINASTATDSPSNQTVTAAPDPDVNTQSSPHTLRPCPFCQTGHLEYVRRLQPNELLTNLSIEPPTTPNSS